MGKIIETHISRWDGGVCNDPRDPRENVARMVTNFDVLTDPYRMTPYRDSEDGHDNASTEKIQNFGIGLRTGTTYSLYGLGVTAGGGVAEVYYKDLTTGSANDLDDDAWAETANNADSAGATDFRLFVFYAKTGKFYGAAAGTRIWSYAADGSAFVATAQEITYTDIAQGLVHSKDDILYIPYDNKIAKCNNDVWTAEALVLPTHFVITSICEFGNYLAIACQPKSGIGNSRVFLWDRDATLATVNESIDWGEGALTILDVVDGELVGISLAGGTAVDFPTFSSGYFKDRVIFKKYDYARGAVQFLELTGGANTTLLPERKQKLDNQLYFLMKIEINGAVRAGLWSLGRSSGSSQFVLTHKRTPNNDTVWTTSSGDTLEGFILIGDYKFITYQDGGVFGMSKTNDSASYTATSIYESKIFDGGDPSLKKDLIGFTIKTQPLPTAGQVVVKYAIDENIGGASWTTILTGTTDNAISHSTVVSLPKDYKEIQFRIESTGNAVVIGYSFREEITGKREYD